MVASMVEQSGGSLDATMAVTMAVMKVCLSAGWKVVKKEEHWAVQMVVKMVAELEHTTAVL